ncbi:hypothetical protein L1987_55193 [Smallanthus sonchifolius]|uniref:Uncharacterized protein n=1 Tax=Smallanthus sonchifolius TaxID=185202 RepID=A0ACB9EAB3_9ASTR|nr:hypothetical protein L1987_55193 [Smallanthus sonchifolius]
MSTMNNSVIRTEGAIGLPFNDQSNTSIYPFAAVEFDSFGTNDWDPRYPNSTFTIGDHVALINYYSDSKTLTVSFTDFINNSPVWVSGLDYTIELRDVVLEWASGVSASTEELSAENSVRSWMRKTYEFKVDQISSLPQTTKAMKENKKTLVLLMVGLIAAMSILVTVLAILTYLLWWRKKNNDDKVEMNNEFEMEAAMPRRFSYLELAHSTAEFAEVLVEFTKVF